MLKRGGAPSAKAPPVCRIVKQVTKTNTSRGTSARQARISTPLAGSMAVATSPTMGVPPSRTSWPVLRARCSAFSIGPKSRPVAVTRPTMTRARMQ